MIPLGIDVLEKVMTHLSKNNPLRKPQEGQASTAPPIKKELGHVDWTKPARALENLVRGLVEWPGVSARLPASEGGSKQLKILKAASDAIKCAEAGPGEILEANKKGVFVQTGEGRLILLEVQPEGKKAMPAWAFWQGARLKVGDKFS